MRAPSEQVVDHGTVSPLGIRISWHVVPPVGGENSPVLLHARAWPSRVDERRELVVVHVGAHDVHDGGHDARADRVLADAEQLAGLQDAVGGVRGGRVDARVRHRERHVVDHPPVRLEVGRHVVGPGLDPGRVHRRVVEEVVLARRPVGEPAQRRVPALAELVPFLPVGRSR